MAKIFWDTNLFIYLIEDSPQFADRVVALRQSMLARRDTLYTSSLTIGEVLAKPVAAGNQVLADKYRSFFRGPAITVLPFDESAAERYADIRVDRSIARPDAIQLACAAT